MALIDFYLCNYLQIIISNLVLYYYELLNYFLESIIVEMTQFNSSRRKARYIWLRHLPW